MDLTKIKKQSKDMKIGIGYDIHELVENRDLILGGVHIPYEKGPKGHSDGDALLHAICDSILGALGKGDIGRHFPDTDPKYKDISSKLLLEKVASLMIEEGYSLGNLDAIVILEQPKIGPYNEEMVGEISFILKTAKENVNIKGKTSEQIGPIGQNKAVAAYAAVMLTKQ